MTREQSDAGVSRRRFIGAVAGLSMLGGCSGETNTDSTPEVNTNSTPSGEPFEALDVVKVEIARQYGKIGVRGVLKNTNPVNGGDSCARVALYDGDEVVFEDYITVSEEGGDWGPFVKWWNVNEETAERIDGASAEVIAAKCNND